MKKIKKGCAIMYSPDYLDTSTTKEGVVW